MSRPSPEAGTIVREPKFSVRDTGEPLNVLGDNQFILLTGEDTEGRFTLIENENPPGVGPPLHIHRNEDEVFYVLAGRIEFRIGDERTVADAGTTVLLPRDSTHTWRVVGEEPARALLMLFPAGIEEYFRELSALAREGEPDLEEVLHVSARHGIEFPER